MSIISLYIYIHILCIISTFILHIGIDAIVLICQNYVIVIVVMSIVRSSNRYVNIQTNGTPVNADARRNLSSFHKSIK